MVLAVVRSLLFLSRKQCAENALLQFQGKIEQLCSMNEKCRAKPKLNLHQNTNKKKLI